MPCLSRKGIVIISSLLVFGGSLFLFKYVKKEFVPAQDQDLILIAGQSPPGSSLEATDIAAKALEEIVRSEPGVEGFFVSVGAGGPGGGQINSIFMPVALKPRGERDKGHLEIMESLRGKFKEVKGARVNMRDASTRNLTSGRQNPVAVNLRGPDLEVLSQKAQELIERLEKENLAVDLDTDYKAGIPELVVAPNRDAMAARGVSVDAVGQVLSASVGGIRQGRYTADGRRYDIRFKLPDHLMKSPKDLNQLFVRNSSNNLVSMGDLVKIEEKKASQTINRVNRQRSVSVFGNLGKGQSQADVLQKTEKILKEILPTGYGYAFEGAAAGLGEAFGSLTTALLAGILVAYLILAVQFNSFIHPISVLIALPFSVTGAVVTIWLSGSSLNLFSFIGLIVLMGIAKKNSILLVEFTNQIREKAKDLSVYEALLEACPVRLRPILMTSVATVAAALPLVLGSGLGHEARLPMGLAIIGGTIFSTVLTLFVVPAVYLGLSRFENR
jgi:multidrug efflux pump subunit AcrB